MTAREEKLVNAVKIALNLALINGYSRNSVLVTILKESIGRK